MIVLLLISETWTHNKFAEGRGSKERVEAAGGRGANLKEQITAQGAERDGLRAQPKGWSLLVEEMDSPCWKFSGF